MCDCERRRALLSVNAALAVDQLPNLNELLFGNHVDRWAIVNGARTLN